MLLDLGKAASLLLSILSLYQVAATAFFTPATHWEERLLLALPLLVIAAAVSIVSGILFRWPSPSNPEAGQPLIATLPIQLFLWTIPTLAVLFALSSYILWQRNCDLSAVCTLP